MAHPIERRSSKPRTGAATVDGGAPSFVPTTEGWMRIEQAYGRELDEKDRVEISGIVNKFFDWRRFEKAAPLVANSKYREGGAQIEPRLFSPFQPRWSQPRGRIPSGDRNRSG